MFDLIRTDLEKYKQVFDISKNLETMYSPFTPVNQYQQSDLKQVPRKFEIVDLKKVMEERAPPQEIADLLQQNSKLNQEKVAIEKMLNDKLYKAENRAREVEDVKDKLEQQIKQSKFDFDE